MKYTDKLGLPIWDNPETDVFDIGEFNKGNQVVDDIVKEYDKRIETINSQLDNIEINILNFSNYVKEDDWTIAFEEAFRNAPCKVHVPKGEYNIKYIEIPSNCTLTGDFGATIFNVIQDGNYRNIITNSDYINGNENIIIKDIILNCNSVNVSTLNAIGSGITFANVKNCICENVKVTNPSLHCFDVMADRPYQLLNESYDNNEYYNENKRSKNIRFINCEGYGASDDTFTTHYSDYVYFENCRAYENYYNGEGSENRNGFEIDDGSKNIFINNCYTERNARGYEIKAHVHSPAPENVTLNNCIAYECSIAYQLRHIGHHLANEVESNGKYVVLNNCKAINPTYNNKYPGLNSQALQISAYKYVDIMNFKAIGKEDSVDSNRAVISTQYKSSNINFVDTTIEGFRLAKQMLYILGGEQHSDNVNITNCTITNGGLEGISVGSNVSNVVLENCNIEVNGQLGSKGVSTSKSSKVYIKNINVSNAEVNIKLGDNLINDTNSKNVLWSGEANVGGTSINLSENLNNYDYLLIDIDFSGPEQRILDYKNNTTNYIKGLNISNTLESTTSSIYELKLVKTNDTTLTLEHNMSISLKDMSKIVDDEGVNITRITGIRL